MRDALNSALDEEMVRDENVFIIGEEVRDGLYACKLKLLLLLFSAYAVPHHKSSRMVSFAGWRVPGSLQGNAFILVPVVACHDTAKLLYSDLQNCAQITKGLLQKHGAMRVRDTPITEVSVIITSHVSYVILVLVGHGQQMT